MDAKKIAEKIIVGLDEIARNADRELGYKLPTDDVIAMPLMVAHIQSALDAELPPELPMMMPVEIKIGLPEMKSYLDKELRRIEDAFTTPHWIPVTERLPETDGVYVMVSCFDQSTKKPKSYIGWYDGEWYILAKRGDQLRLWSCVADAWQPLPSPYVEMVTIRKHSAVGSSEQGIEIVEDSK